MQGCKVTARFLQVPCRCILQGLQGSLYKSLATLHGKQRSENPFGFSAGPNSFYVAWPSGDCSTGRDIHNARAAHPDSLAGSAPQLWLSVDRPALKVPAGNMPAVRADALLDKAP